MGRRRGEEEERGTRGGEEGTLTGVFPPSRTELDVESAKRTLPGELARPATVTNPPGETPINGFTIPGGGPTCGPLSEPGMEVTERRPTDVRTGLRKLVRGALYCDNDRLLATLPGERERVDCASPGTKNDCGPRNICASPGGRTPERGSNAGGAPNAGFEIACGWKRRRGECRGCTLLEPGGNVGEPPVLRARPSSTVLYRGREAHE